MDNETNDALRGSHHASASMHRRSSSPGSGLLSKFPFMRISTDTITRQTEDDVVPTSVAGGSSPAVSQQHKTRRRRGSLRKVALLGRGAQREHKDSRSLTIDTSQSPSSTEPSTTGVRDALGLSISDITQLGPIKTALSSPASAPLSPAATNNPATIETPPDREAEPRNLYNSTTDEEDVLQIPRSSLPTRNTLSVSSGSESYYANHSVVPQRRSFQQAKSPLSYSGISTTPLPPHDADWDYSETEWWGWVVLGVTWFVFVTGMGSCLDVWWWAWDVGKTPYAPPELEDDPTLPIVGYYPALIILTGVMAWVWVVVAWVGMKYFRHAKISGD